MSFTDSLSEHRDSILQSGLSGKSVSRWLVELEDYKLARKSSPGSLAKDARSTGRLISKGWKLCASLPVKSARDEGQLAAGRSLVFLITTLCREFCRLHRQTMYEELTGNYSGFLRTDELAGRAARLWPGIFPSDKQLAEESSRLQKDKDGLELNQGILFSQLLIEPRSGIHLLQAMLRPLPRSNDLLQQFTHDGSLHLDHAVVENIDGTGVITMRHPEFLNAEDDFTLPDFETAVDLVLMHPQINIGVLRGAVVDHPRYRGRRVFDSGINLTRIYQGGIPYLFYLTRDFGVVNKLYYGLAGDRPWNEDDPYNTREKLWVAAVESFAIGGGCQLLLVMDYVIAEQGSYFNLPARKEGIIPGAANLRLARFLGDSLAREGILFDRQFRVEDPEASRLVNRVVPAEKMDEALYEFTRRALDSGMVSAAGNRKVLRTGQETLDIYRRYMANFAEIQAYCHLSDQLIHNLEKYWTSRKRSQAQDA